MEAIKNWGLVTVSTGYDNSATSIALSTGDGAKLPQPSTDGVFRVVWWNYTDYPNPADDPYAEIVTVTARSTDTLTVVRPASGNNYHGEGSDNDAQAHNTAGKTYRMALVLTKKIMDDINTSGVENLLKNGNFHNVSTNGYGGTPEDWTSSFSNLVQGGFPELTKQQLIDLLGISDGDIEGLWNLDEASGNALDLSSNGYDLTDTNTVGASDDGLKGKARLFASASSEDFRTSTITNINVSGSQTWFAMFKPSSVGSNKGILRLSGGSGLIQLYVNANLYISSNITGLTTTSSMNSNVLLEANKWYFAVLIYDSANSKYKLWVNGVKLEATASGSVTSSAGGNFYIGSLAGTNYFDGLIQTTGMLSVALSDAQVKRLFAATMWKGIKIRRATTDALIYQDLDEHLVERLRGRTVTLRARVYATSTNHRIYIYDGTTTTAMSPSSADAWQDVYVTATISSTATQIRVGIEADTTDGSMWAKEVAICEGSMARSYQPSQNDLVRFPRLLRLDIPAMVDGKPYQYEESRFYSYVISGYTGFSSNPTMNGRFMFSGKKCKFIALNDNVGVSNANTFGCNLPIKTAAIGGDLSRSPTGVAYDNGAWQADPMTIGLATNSGVAVLSKSNTAVWTTSGNKLAAFNVGYVID